jgi:hypothetical protein
MDHQIQRPKTAASRGAVVAARALLLALAAGAAGAAGVIALRAPAVTGVRYGCPMHAKVSAASPGECPICHMALEPVARTEAPATTDAESPAPQEEHAYQNLGRHKVIDFVRRRALLVHSQELRGPAWVDADGVVTALLYDDQIAALGDDEAGTFTTAAAPRQAFAVRRLDSPSARWDGATSQVRFRLVTKDGRSGAPRPEQTGWLELPRRPRQVLGVPVGAVLQAPEGPYVLVAAGARKFEKRPIRVGATYLKLGFAVVLEGLRVNERVAAGAAFFIDADRRARSGADQETEDDP